MVSTNTSSEHALNLNNSRLLRRNPDDSTERLLEMYRKLLRLNIEYFLKSRTDLIDDRHIIVVSLLGDVSDINSDVIHWK